MSDYFADIAAGGIGGNKELLCDNLPACPKEVASHLKVSDTASLSLPVKSGDTPSLRAELADLRAKYEPFLQNYAPQVEPVTRTQRITDFCLDGKRITLPHYEGPCGCAKKVYTSEFIIEEVNPQKAHYICIDGADYKAFVYVNDVCVGCHEGFFSPFEFCIDSCIKAGKNILRIDLYNDYIYMGNKSVNGTHEGDKLYAATGLGWDDPLVGWHHCPPGMGIYGDVRVETRSRLSIADIFVRDGQVWVEVLSADYDEKDIEIGISVYGQNFKETVLRDLVYSPSTIRTVGFGDSLTESQVGDDLGKGMPMYAEYGINVYKIPLDIPNPRIWSPDCPYLYNIQLELRENSKVMDRRSRQFGIRSFIQDTESSPKGMFYLNGNKIRLRGANTMGFEQQDVLRADYDRLIDDILLAKLCNMNFLRLTQRPVQDVIYEYCDKLGMMTQTDLPLFGCMRRSKFPEGIRQAEEMERIVRSHPCNILVSYINEPFPNANNKPHRHLDRGELMDFFDCCDKAVRLMNPDRVTKHVDGDYDPPSDTMPDNHCYPMWYNGHGIDIGMLNKGYWLATRPDWYYGCGEFGAEGLDFSDVMKKSYPKEWITEPFEPNNIVNAQTGRFYRFFYDRCEDMESWIQKSQEHQAFATKIMSEAMRRDSRMVSNAIHLFIDAWPAGWMKSIMDWERKPKAAYFAYRDAMEPLMLSLRCDRFTYFEDEEISVECYLCNDTNIVADYRVVYEMDNLRAQAEVQSKDCDVSYVSTARFKVDVPRDRRSCVLRAVLLDRDGTPLTSAEQTIEVFKRTPEVKETKNEIIMKLAPGKHIIAGEEVEVKACSMLPLHFAGRKTGHPAVAEFKEKDFSYWYDKSSDMITPIIDATFTAEGFTPILIGGNTDSNDEWSDALVCASKEYQGKTYIICNVDLRTENPVAYRFLNILRKLGEN